MRLSHRLFLPLVLVFALLTASLASAQDHSVKGTSFHWAMQVRAWLLAYTAFPVGNAVKHGENRPPQPSGTAVVSFDLNREGRLISSSMTRSSGNDVLDRAALTSIKRAEPFPRPPSSLPESHYKFTIPIRFVGTP